MFDKLRVKINNAQSPVRCMYAYNPHIILYHCFETVTIHMKLQVNPSILPVDTKFSKRKRCL